MAARYPIAKIVGSRIKKLRREYGLTGTEVAMALNVSQQQFSRYERGINRIDIDSLVMIADFLKVSVHYFLEDIEQSNSWTSEYNSLLSHGFYSKNKKTKVSACFKDLLIFTVHVSSYITSHVIGHLKSLK
ncbi:helix-turn-helix domain-containing protein [Providencia rettgeri]|uniref:helix-turn-helix domain-containing protein n=1 Tax=Providencia rettgeri TaxID=587 RepID=UPI00029BD6F5|nr:helix-turn-helix transcriptional regulator [Providencia rettgeri]EKT58986.1 fimbrial operon regulator [Providencia rettgeri Dmel1]